MHTDMLYALHTGYLPLGPIKQNISHTRRNLCFSIRTDGDVIIMLRKFDWESPSRSKVIQQLSWHSKATEAQYTECVLLCVSVCMCDVVCVYMCVHVLVDMYD